MKRSVRPSNFIGIPKTASTSMGIATEPYRDKIKKHYHLDWEYDGNFCFTFVRNPWDRAVSAWLHIHSPANQNVERHKRPMDFAEYVRHLRATPLRIEFSAMWSDRGVFTGWEAWHTIPQYVQIERHTIDGLFIGRFENLQSDWRRVCRLIGIEGTELPHTRRMERQPYTTYYTPETRGLIADHYQRDIELFGYAYGE